MMNYELYIKHEYLNFHDIFDQYNFSQELLNKIDEIRSLAACIHAEVNQYYDDLKPYVYHLDMVADQFMYLYKTAVKHFNAKELDDDTLLMLLFAAYFHDTIEDCRIHYYDVIQYASRFLRKKYATQAAEIVFALTEEKGRTRADRHNEKYYNGIANTTYASCIKTADMCANMIYSWYKSRKRYGEYYDEWTTCKMKMLDDTGVEFSHNIFCVAQEYIKFIPALYPTLDKEELLLSEEDMENISKIACDWASGNYLIRPRADEYLKKFSETMEILSKPDDEKTGRDKQITEYFNACSEPKLFYWFCGKYGLKNGKDEYERYYN